MKRPEKVGADRGRALRRTKLFGPLARRAFCMAGLWSVCSLAGAAGALADTFTPSLTTSLGYTDNVRFRSNAVADAFVSIKPGFTMDYGKPNRKLSASGALTYSQYIKNPDLSQLENVSLDVNYFHAFTRRTNLRVGNQTSATYDAPVFDDQGGLVRIRTDGGRRDQNRTYARAEHGWGHGNMLWLGYGYIVTRYDEDTARNSDGQEATAGVQIRHNETWQSTVSGTGKYVDYEAQRDNWYATAQYQLTYSLDKTKQFTLLGRYTNSVEEEGYGQQGVDYEVYTFQAGFSHRVSPNLDWSLMAGMSAVVGKSNQSSRNDDDYPAITLTVGWHEKLWNLKFQGETSVGEFDFYGDERGLTFRKRVSLYFDYNFARHWRFATEASYVDNNYIDDPVYRDGGDSDITALRGVATVTWSTTRYWDLSWKYLYQETQGQENTDNRRENQILMSLTGKIPYRW